MTDYTTTELKFKKLHRELLSLELFELANDISSVFYQSSTENYKEGAKMVKEIYKL